MANINYPYISEYLANLYQTHPPELRGIEAYAHANSVPIMERESIELLKSLIKIKKPKRILELGTAIGYSAIIMCLLDGDIRVTSMDRSEAFVEVARKNIKAFGLEDRIDIVFGDISQTLEDIGGAYDLLFFDAAKGHYQEYFDKSVRLMKEGSLIFSDNVLFKGRIANDSLVDKRQKTITKRMRSYLEFLTSSPGIHTVVIPIGDGVAISTIEEINKWKK